MLSTSKDTLFKKVHVKFIMSVELWIINTTAKLNSSLKTKTKRWWHLKGCRCVTGKSFTTLCKYHPLVWLTGLLILRAWEQIVKNLGTAFRNAAGVLAKKPHTDRSSRFQNLVMKYTECLISQHTNSLRYLKVNTYSIINLHSNVLEVITVTQISGSCVPAVCNRTGFSSSPFKKATSAGIKQ